MNIVSVPNSRTEPMGRIAGGGRARGRGLAWVLPGVCDRRPVLAPPEKTGVREWQPATAMQAETGKRKPTSGWRLTD